MNLTFLIIAAVGGALGGWAVGSMFKKSRLSARGNAIGGALVGGFGAYFAYPIPNLLLEELARTTLGISLGPMTSGFLSGGFIGGLAALFLSGSGDVGGGDGDVGGGD